MQLDYITQWAGTVGPGYESRPDLHTPRNVRVQNEVRLNEVPFAQACYMH